MMHTTDRVWELYRASVVGSHGFSDRTVKWEVPTTPEYLCIFYAFWVPAIACLVTLIMATFLPLNSDGVFSTFLAVGCASLGLLFAGGAMAIHRLYLLSTHQKMNLRWTAHRTQVYQLMLMYPTLEREQQLEGIYKLEWRAKNIVTFHEGSCEKFSKEEQNAAVKESSQKLDAMKLVWDAHRNIRVPVAVACGVNVAYGKAEV